MNTKNRRRRGATPAQQTWNKGHVGTPSAPAVRRVGRECERAECGTLGTEPRPGPGMVLAVWLGSREPDRWYCAGPCVAYGRALAEVRAIEVRRG